MNFQRTMNRTNKAEDYIAEAQRQLIDTTSFEKLDNDPAPAYNNI